MSEFAELVARELSRARRIHPGAIHGWHEGESVIPEEFDEMVAEVRRKHVNKEDLLKELVQVAAMCQRMAEDTLLTTR